MIDKLDHGADILGLVTKVNELVEAVNTPIKTNVLMSILVDARHVAHDEAAMVMELVEDGLVEIADDGRMAITDAGRRHLMGVKR